MSRRLSLSGLSLRISQWILLKERTIEEEEEPRNWNLSRPKTLLPRITGSAAAYVVVAEAGAADWAANEFVTKVWTLQVAHVLGKINIFEI